MTEPMASEPAEPTTRQDPEWLAGMIAAFLSGARGMTQLKPWPEVAERLVAWLDDRGLLADPAQTTELERLRFLNGEAEHQLTRALDELRERTAERDRIGARLDAARLNASDAERTAEELRGVRDVLSLLLRGMARKLVNYRKWMSGDDVPVVHRLRREAAERQDRLDAITETLAAAGRMMTSDSRDWSLSRSDVWLYGLLVSWECDEQHEHDEVMCGGDGALREVAAQHGWTVEDTARIRRFRAALVGDQPPTEEPKTGTCSTPCDDDCGADCHEYHQVPWKRDHEPQTCPGWRGVASERASHRAVEEADDAAGDLP